MLGKARSIGINHVSIEVGSIQEALDFYGSIFEIKQGHTTETESSIELGDQFLAFTVGQSINKDKPNHFGLVVDDKELVSEQLKLLGIEPLPTRFFGFLDPWGNHIEVINYENVMFTKPPDIMKALSLDDVEKNQRAISEMIEKGYLTKDGDVS